MMILRKYQSEYQTIRKIQISVIVTVLLGFLSFCQANQIEKVSTSSSASLPDVSGYRQPAQVNIQIAENLIQVNGKQLDLPTSRAKVLELLGTPDRSTALANWIYTYDRLGIHLYEAPGSGIVSTISISMDPEEYAFSPKQGYTGQLKVGKMALNKHSKIEDAINGLGRETCEVSFFSMCKFGVWNVYLGLSGTGPIRNIEIVKKK